MVQLPEEATLAAHLEHGAVEAESIDELARRLARFHAEAEGGATVARGGSFETVARNAREKFEQSADQVGETLSKSTRERLTSLTEAALADLRDKIAARAPEAFREHTRRSSASITSTGFRRDADPMTGWWSIASNSTNAFAMPTRSPRSLFGDGAHD